MGLHEDSIAEAIAALPWSAPSASIGHPTQARRACRIPKPPNAEMMALEALADAQRAVRVGLSDVHTSPRYWAEYSTAGAYLAVKERGVRQSRPPDARRGRVLTFSRRSRSRMIETCAKIDRNAQATALCVTLTYPSSFPTNSVQYKRHLDTFWKRCHRVFPGLSAIWKLEFQARGAPHFHLLIYGQRFIPAAWVARAWYEVVGSNDPRHLVAGTEVRRVMSYRHAVSYAAKYLGKVVPNGTGDAWAGRYWGVLGRRALPYSLVQRRLGKGGAIRLARILRGLSRSRGYRPRQGGQYARWAVCHGERASALVEWLARELPVYPLT